MFVALRKAGGRARPWIAAGIAVAASVALLLNACAAGSVPPPGGQDGSADAATNDETSNACNGDMTKLQASCETLCTTIQTAKCMTLEVYIPQVYHLYTINDGTPAAKTNCISSCTNMSAACADSVSAVIDCANAGSCVSQQWVSPAACATQASAATQCAKDCLGLKDCVPAQCNDSISAGSVYCYWACVNNVCKETCN